MDILLLQADLAWNSPEENYSRISRMVGRSPSAELIVLPEMFSTGFVTEPEVVAEKYGAKTLGWMAALADATKAAIVGSVAVEDNGCYYNRCYFVRPDGTFETYDKRHLFGYGGENAKYCAGNSRTIVEWGGFRILLQVCYDLRFPVFSRNCGDYDMVLYVANWPQSRRQAWDLLLRARAVENVCYVAGVNRVGSDPVCDYDGGTIFVDYTGNVMGAAAGSEEEALFVNADMGTLRSFREKFRVLGDADAFRIEI